LNSIGNIGVFLLYSWDKIYYILKKEGDNSMTYFIFKRHEECLKHKSTYCGCNLNMTKADMDEGINNYIDIYKTCSTIFEIVRGKIRFIKIQKSPEF